MCTIAFVNEKGKVHIFKGETNGTIVDPTDKVGFGWDVCFQPNGYKITFSQMSHEEKNRISHRTKAMQKLVKFLSKNGYAKN